MLGCTNSARAVASSDCAVLEVRRERVDQGVPGAGQRARRPPRPGAAGHGRRRPAPARAAGRRCATGRGASGQPTAARRPDSAARAEAWARGRSSARGPTTTGPSPKKRTTAWAALSVSLSATPPRITTSRSPWIGAQGVHARRPGPPGVPGRRGPRSAACGRRAEHDDDTLAMGPAQRAGPRGDGLVGLGAQHGVDDEGLEPGVPGAARLGGPGIDLGGGEGDLAGVAQDRGVHGRCVGRVDQVVDVGLHDLDAQPDQVDGLAQGDHAGQRPGRRAEDRRRRVAREGVVVVQPEPVDEPLDAGLEDLADPGPALGRELGEPRHVGQHPGHRGGAERAGRAAQRVGGALAGRLCASRGRRRAAAGRQRSRARP